jgi:hypothetical protein
MVGAIYSFGKFGNLLLSVEEIAERVQIRKSVCRFRKMEISEVFTDLGNPFSAMASGIQVWSLCT